jgi:hypothetical protein
MPRTQTYRDETEHASGHLAVKICVIAGVALSTILLVWAGALARPIADDYCAAQIVADEGIFGHVQFGWQRTGGAAFQYLVYSVYPGILMNVLPWALAGILIILAPAVSIGMIAWFAWTRIERITSARITASIAIIGSVSLGWFAAWTINGVASTIFRAPVGSSSIEAAQANWFGLTTFFLVHANQIMTILLAVGWAAVLLTSWKAVWRVFLAVVVGLATGFAGPQFTAMFIASSLAVALTRFIPTWKTFRTKADAKFIAIAVIAASLAFLYSSQSPGFVYRKSASGSAFSTIGAIESISSSLYLWLIRLISPGMLLALFIGICIGLLWKATFHTRSFQFPILLLLVSLVSAFATGVCHIFIYSAYWHDIPWTIPLYLAVVFFGSQIGQLLMLRRRGPFIERNRSAELKIVKVGMEFSPPTLNNRRMSAWGMPVILVITAILVLTSAAQTVHARGRLIEWNSGPAPQVGGVSDIEGDTYFTSCWTGWFKSKDTVRSLVN